jgi:hypothetical protein
MELKHDAHVQAPTGQPAKTSQSVDWYHEGESRTVEVNGVQVTVRLIGRKGRRSRIAIVAPAGAEFRSQDYGSQSR